MALKMWIERSPTKDIEEFVTEVAYLFVMKLIPIDKSRTFVLGQLSQFVNKFYLLFASQPGQVFFEI